MNQNDVLIRLFSGCGCVPTTSESHVVVDTVDDVVDGMAPEADASAQTVLAHVEPENQQAVKDGDVC